MNNDIISMKTQNYDNVCTSFVEKGFIVKNATISILKANLMALITATPFMVLFFLLYFFINGLNENWLELIIFPKALALIGVGIISVFVHELLHGIGWFGFCKSKWKSIFFGVLWSSLTPYCHCKEPLNIHHYYVGMLMPFVILGIIPSIVSIIVSSKEMFLFGLYNVMLAGGDITVAFLLVKYFRCGVMVIDHPNECGCTLFIPSK